MITRYHAFLDESGQRDYGPATDRYFVVAGAIVRLEHLSTYQTEIAGLKRAFFGTPDVEIKSHWLRNPGQCRRHYLEPFSLTEKKLALFVESLYDWILATDIAFIAGVVDKRQMEERYNFPHNPSAVGYHIFLQRYQKFLASRHSGGAVTFDEISGSTKAKNAWKDLLLRQHRTLKTRGCRYTRTQFTNVEEDLCFADSSESSMLQLADLAAYNTFRQFRSYGSQWDNPNAQHLTLYEYFARLLPRFHKDPNGVFAGYGIAKMPRKAYNRWLVPSKLKR